MTTTTTERNVGNEAREHSLAFYHPMSAGNGTAVQLEPRVNRRETDRYNCFFMEMAAQKSVASRESDRKAPATFDWEKKLTVKLGFTDVCEMLAVLEGRVDKAGGVRNGLYHQTGQASTVISFQKGEKGGYFLGLSRKDKTGDQLSRLHITLSESEAIGLRSVFQAGLFFITFHTHLFAGPRARSA